MIGVAAIAHHDDPDEDQASAPGRGRTDLARSVSRAAAQLRLRQEPGRRSADDHRRHITETADVLLAGVDLRQVADDEVVGRPTMRAPTKVIGRLRSRPIIDAAYALTISSVSGSADRFSLGATRMPASEASCVPMTHDVCDDAVGPGAVQHRQRPVVDGRAHGDTETGVCTAAPAARSRRARRAPERSRRCTGCRWSRC